MAGDIPFCSGSRHSQVISKTNVSVNLAGLLITLTPSRETTDIFATVCGGTWYLCCCMAVDKPKLGYDVRWM